MKRKKLTDTLETIVITMMACCLILDAGEITAIASILISGFIFIYDPAVRKGMIKHE